MTNGIIPIFYACDEQFIRYTVVSVSSLIRNAAKDRRYHIHILCTTIPETAQAKLLALANDRFGITFENVEGYLDSIADRLPTRHYYTKTTYYRLFIPEMFPQYEKAIYLDSDTVVEGDIAALYDQDPGDCYVAACHEQAMVQVDPFGSYVEKVLGVSRHNYFNAGVMLMNCGRFREGKALERFADLLNTYHFVVTQDEDYLNLICKDHVRFLDQRWNTELTEGLTYPYDEREAHILHYIMVNKPWHYDTCRLADVFWKYADETSVAGELHAELDAYTDADRERDRQSAENLCQLAKEEITREDNYQRLLDKTVHAADRVAIVRKIAQFERQGMFDVDVEEDPPSKPLLPDEIDYLRRSLPAKIKTKIAYLRAKRFLDYIIKHKLMIIREIKGIENMRDLRSGAVITCNHFNAFDSFAMHAAYLASGQKKRTLYRVIREGNYTSFPGFYGFLMRHFYTLPLSSHPKTMQKFIRATDHLLSEGNFVLIYPEQSMWWNYRKPKPLKPGAYRFSVKNGVPVLPCFITMKDSELSGSDGYPIQEYTITVGKPIYPDKSLAYKDNIAMLMEENARIWREIYEREYEMPLEYETGNALSENG